MAAIHEEILLMPMAYETLISEGGTGLSGGQIQRICIARALVGNPRILLLDEATSHLDIVTEELIDRNLNGMECTRIVIAHRLSTVHNADVIVVLDAGAIVEEGTHDQLLMQDGQYYTLVHKQLELEHARYKSIVSLGNRDVAR